MKKPRALLILVLVSIITLFFSAWLISTFPARAIKYILDSPATASVFSAMQFKQIANMPGYYSTLSRDSAKQEAMEAISDENKVWEPLSFVGYGLMNGTSLSQCISKMHLKKLQFFNHAVELSMQELISSSEVNELLSSVSTNQSECFILASRENKWTSMLWKKVTNQATESKNNTAIVSTKVFQDCTDCPEMVEVPAGSFDMGKTSDIHRVTLNKFAIGKTEVTQGQWIEIMGSNPSEFSSCGENCPVENITWANAKEFISRLNSKTGLNYRLPSESEWEYACRAGVTSAYCGGDYVDILGWIRGNGSGKTHPVAKKMPNSLGLYDMTGNVAEWVEDIPQKEEGWHVVRGSGYMSWATHAQATDRDGGEDSDSLPWYGFRLARTLP